MNDKYWCSKCSKTTFRLRRDAENARKEMVRRGKHLTKKGKLVVYRCPHKDSGHHLGHRP